MKKIIKTLARSIREYKKPAILTPVFVGIEVVLECIIPFVMAKLIDNMNTGSLSQLIVYGVILLCLAMLSLVFGITSGKIAATASSGFAKNVRKDMFFKIQDFSFAEIDKFSINSLITRLTTDVGNVQSAFQMITRIAVRAPLMLIFSMIMSFSINWKMALIFVGILPILGLGLGFIIAKALPLFKRIFKKYDKLNNSVQENVSSIKDVKSYVREDYEIKKFNDAATDVRNDFVKADKLVALNNPLMYFCLYSAILLVGFLGAKLIITSGSTSLTTGELSSLINYGVQILVSMMMLSMIFVMLSMSVESSKRIYEVLNEESTLKNNTSPVFDIKNGDIEFKNVSFKYSASAEKDALKDVNLKINSGEVVGILGATGSSKTTLIQLIPRLFDATNGEVFVSGINVKNYDLKSLRDAVSVVLQKNVLFSGTIKENVKWGKNNATDDEIIEACKIAQADEFVDQLPSKYDSKVEQGGSNFSGGQKQRLCIARAIIKSPKIIIFDDSTSAVDTKTDAKIRVALKNYLPSTTKIIIAQRIASVQDADKIVVLDGGRIVESGNHEQLIALGGIYKELFDSQTKGGK